MLCVAISPTTGVLQGSVLSPFSVQSISIACQIWLGLFKPSLTPPTIISPVSLSPLRQWRFLTGTRKTNASDPLSLRTTKSITWVSTEPRKRCTPTAPWRYGGLHSLRYIYRLNRIQPVRFPVYELWTQLASAQQVSPNFLWVDCMPNLLGRNGIWSSHHTIQSSPHPKASPGPKAPASECSMEPIKRLK